MTVERFSRFLLRHRTLFAIGYLVVTAFFVQSLGRLQVATIFSDLFPYTHPYVRTFGEYGPIFGSPLGVVLALEKTRGDVFETATLEKIRRITDALDRIPGVNHNQVVSLTSPRVKRMEMQENLIEVAALVGGEIPRTAEGLRELKRRATTTEGVMGILVSPDSRATMISANFFESEIDYDLVFRRIGEIVDAESDETHRIHAAGQPLLTGWIYHHYRETSWLFGASLASMVLLLALYFRNVAGVVAPLVVGIVSAVWGFGLVALLGYNLDPLIIVVPVLLVARALSHSVQMCERYFELYCETGDVKESAAKSLDSLLSPGAVGIFTDAMGLFVIMIAPIGVVQKLGLVCGLWSLALLGSVVLLSPLVVSVLPAPRNARDVVLRSAEEDPKMLARFFDALWLLSATRSRSVATVSVFLAGAVLCGWWASKRDVGNVGAGSPLLWPESSYNRSIHAINEQFVGSDQLHVIVEGDREDAVKQPAVLRTAIEFQAHMEASPDVAATLSVADMIGMGARYLNGGFPKWESIPNDRAWTGSMFQMLSAGSNPGDWDRFFTPDYRALNVIVWFRDHASATVRDGIDRAKRFIESEHAELEGARFRLASGSVGLVAAANEVLRELELMTVAAISVVIFALTSVVYRSLVAGAILVVIANIANLATSAVAYHLGIGVDVNTLPIASVGMGIGIDYNIYFMSRVAEEYRRVPDFERVIPITIRTTGKAIFFTATTMTLAVSLWYFSSLRFQADMGFLLAAVMIAHVLLALLFQPAVTRLLEPRFIGRTVAA